jgi:hypothetical protein
MSDGPVPAPRDQGWIRIVLALAAFLLLPHTPGVPAVVPVVDTLLLLLPALTVCFLLGWRSGGSFIMAALWGGLTAWLYALPTPQGVGGAYYDLARAWGLLVAGAFGVVCLVARRGPFVHRALSAIGLATLLALLLVAFGRLDPRQGERIFADELATRDSLAVASMRESARRIGEQAPELAQMANELVVQRDEVQRVLSREAAPLYPALLALEALAACALAWALYHRLSRARIGPALAPLRTFAFSDQLAWAMVAGITMLVVPSLSAMSVIGRNLIVFFGTLYVLRGYAVYACFVSRRAGATSLVVGIALLPFSLVTVPAALGLGLSDTWFDWRRRAASLSSGRRGP